MWKVYAREGRLLSHVADADEFGDFIPSKHKGPIGETISVADMIRRQLN